MSLSPPGVNLGGYKDLRFLKYYIVLEWDSRFTLELNIFT